MEAKVNWDAIGAVGEVLGSLGVVATLLYLASEFRNNVKKSQMDGLAKAIESQARQFAHLTNEVEKAELVRRALVGFDDLTQGEKGLIHSIFFDICISQNIIRQAHSLGLLDQDEFCALQLNWLSLMRTKGARSWYSVWKHSTPKNWQAYVDAALDDPELTVEPLYDDMPWLYRLESKSETARETQ